ncbi:hypothetical protein BJY04DRAFT_231594 [Aspergillus karnatakaensis]|uniref:flavin-containing monooxygenase n=1 Tax=Aspergillus karnatakaensis TaxID=1810916 RepID=UPI003CCDE9C9
MAATTRVDALVVGASWAGLWALHLLQRQGLNVLLVDACDDVGGTWCYTRYPGCRVDTELPLYEFSDPDLWQNWNWSQRFPAQKEIQAYISWVADRLSLRENIVLRTRVEGARWDELSNTWAVTASNNRIYRTRYLILATGYTTVPYIPAFNGVERFPNSIHTSAWPEHTEWKNKRVGVVGTGGSGLQIIETLAPEVARLTVFQRTPNLATPMRQKDYSKEEMEHMKRHFYPAMLQKRNSATGYFSSIDRATLDDSPQAREEVYQSLWDKGGLAFWFGNYSDLLTSRDANMEAYRFWRDRVHRRVRDQAVAEKLAPEQPPHAFGTKRPSLEVSYFDIFNSPNVELVDVQNDPILEITPTGVQTESKFHEIDLLVYATGYDALTGSALAMNIVGVGGLKLESKWDVRAQGNGVSTALGLMSNGFPNMFFPMGPQAPSALGLTPQMAEVQGQWIANCIQYVQHKGLDRIEATAEAEAHWKAEVMAAAERTLFSETNSWYMGVNIPDRKKQPLCYFGGIGKYAQALQQAANAGYPGFTLSRAAVKHRL